MSKKIRKYAFLFGNSFFTDTRLNELNAPENDIKALHDVLISEEICDFDEVSWAVNSTLAAVQTKLMKFLRGKKRDDFILVYYTGHGLLDDENCLYLALTGSNAEYPDIESMSSPWLKHKLNRCGSERQLLILDCCHSGAYIDGTKSAKDALAINTDTFDNEGYGRYVLASSARTQYSIETNGESDYTKTLVEGLKTGSASDGKNWVSVKDLEEFLTSKFANSVAPMRPQSEVCKRVGQLKIASNPSFVEPVSSALLMELIARDSTIRLGAVSKLQMLAENTTSEKRREEIITVLRKRLDPEIENTEDSKSVTKAIEQVLNKLEHTNYENKSLSNENSFFYNRIWSINRTTASQKILLGSLVILASITSMKYLFPEMAGNTLTLVEKELTAKELGEIQKAICLSPGAAFNTQTRDGIEIVKQAFNIMPINGTISNASDLTLLRKITKDEGNCNLERFSNYLERQSFSAKNSIEKLSVALNNASRDVPIDRQFVLNGELRGKIRRVRKLLSIEPGRWSVDAQVTQALLDRIDFASLKIYSPSEFFKLAPETEKLIQESNSKISSDSMAATAKLINQFSNFSPAIQQALTRFNEDNIGKLTAEGRINLLIFLNATKNSAWNVILVKVAQQKLHFIKERESDGIKIGKTTRKNIDNLTAKLSALKL